MSMYTYNLLVYQDENPTFVKLIFAICLIFFVGMLRQIDNLGSPKL